MVNDKEIKEQVFEKLEETITEITMFLERIKGSWAEEYLWDLINNNLEQAFQKAIEANAFLELIDSPDLSDEFQKYLKIKELEKKASL